VDFQSLEQYPYTKGDPSKHRRLGIHELTSANYIKHIPATRNPGAFYGGLFWDLAPAVIVVPILFYRCAAPESGELTVGVECASNPNNCWCNRDPDECLSRYGSKGETTKDFAATSFPESPIVNWANERFYCDVRGTSGDATRAERNSDCHNACYLKEVCQEEHTHHPGKCKTWTLKHDIEPAVVRLIP